MMITIGAPETWVSPAHVPHTLIHDGLDCATCGRHHFKRTDQLAAGDVLQLTHHVQRTVESITQSGWLNHAGEIIWNVNYTEQAEVHYSPGNSGLASTLWELVPS